jgi:hypothetical protein
VLEDEADAPLLRRKPGRVLLEDRHLAGVRLLEARDHAQKRRLPAPARTEQDRQRPGGNRKGDVVECDEVSEPLGHVANADRHLTTLLSESRVP